MELVRLIEAGQPDPLTLALMVCGAVPANHSAWLFVEPEGRADESVRGLAPPGQLPAVDDTVAVNTLAR